MWNCHLLVPPTSLPAARIVAMVAAQVQLFQQCAVRSSMEAVFQHVRMAALPMVGYAIQSVLIASDIQDPKLAHFSKSECAGVENYVLNTGSCLLHLYLLPCWYFDMLTCCILLLIFLYLRTTRWVIRALGVGWFYLVHGSSKNIRIDIYVSVYIFAFISFS